MIYGGGSGRLNPPAGTGTVFQGLYALARGVYAFRNNVHWSRSRLGVTGRSTRTIVRWPKGSGKQVSGIGGLTDSIIEV